MLLITPEYLVIDTINFGRVNCVNKDVWPLLGRPVRLNNRILDGAPGRRETAPIGDELVESIEIRLRGDVDEDGLPTASPHAGLRDLLATITAAIGTPPTLPAKTYPAELHLDGDVYTADIQVADFSPFRTGPLTATLLLQLVIPAGLWTPP